MAAGGVTGMARNSNSSDNVSITDRFRYYGDLWKTYREGGAVNDITELKQDFAALDAATRTYLGQPLQRLGAIEIGFGARPYRLIYFNACGLDVRGIDMEQPLLTGSALEAMRIARRNGSLRATKSLVRYWVFERRQRSEFFHHLQAVDRGFVFDPARLVLGNAGTEAAWASLGRADLIYSFRVLEHIDRATLGAMVELMYEHLAPNGLCYLIVTVHTGITGGHLPEWYSSRLHHTAKRSAPWEHLRGRRYRADTYLNRMTRRDYVALFSTRFAVLEDTPLVPGLGHEFLTDEIRQELAGFDDYELLSNDVLFVLRRHADA